MILIHHPENVKHQTRRLLGRRLSTGIVARGGCDRWHACVLLSCGITFRWIYVGRTVVLPSLWKRHPLCHAQEEVAVGRGPRMQLGKSSLLLS